MINQILIAVILIISGFSIWQYLEKKSLKTDIKNKDEVIVAYEEYITVLPFNALTSERKDKANEEINATISNIDAIVDNTYKL